MPNGARILRRRVARPPTSPYPEWVWMLVISNVGIRPAAPYEESARWVLTHLPTGLRLTAIADKARAIALARRLTAVLPATGRWGCQPAAPIVARAWRIMRAADQEAA